jgi:hypothetical protein
VNGKRLSQNASDVVFNALKGKLEGLSEDERLAKLDEILLDGEYISRLVYAAECFDSLPSGEFVKFVN